MKWISTLEALPASGAFVLGWLAKRKVARVLCYMPKTSMRTYISSEGKISQGREFEWQEISSNGNLVTSFPFDDISHWANIPNEPSN